MNMNHEYFLSIKVVLQMLFKCYLKENIYALNEITFA